MKHKKKSPLVIVSRSGLFISDSKRWGYTAQVRNPFHIGYLFKNSASIAYKTFIASKWTRSIGGHRGIRTPEPFMLNPKRSLVSNGFFRNPFIHSILILLGGVFKYNTGDPMVITNGHGTFLWLRSFGMVSLGRHYGILSLPLLNGL